MRPRKLPDLIFGLIIWLSIICAIFGFLGAELSLVLVAVIGIAIVFIFFIFPRFETWASNRQPCPHGIQGGLILNRCPKCVEEKHRKARDEQKKIEAEAERKRIMLAAQELQESEAARLRRTIVPNLTELRRLSPQRFEDEMASMFERLGYAVQQTPYSNDFGRDAILKKGGEKFLLECKRYGETNTAGRPELQKFHSAIISDGAKLGFFVTTGTFTSGAKKHAAKIGITLIDGNELLHYMMRSKKSASDSENYLSMCTVCGATVSRNLRSPQPLNCGNGHTVEPSLDIDGLLGKAPSGAAPRCKRCGKPMKLINGRNGRFWGCSQYPRCRSSRPWRPQLHSLR